MISKIMKINFRHEVKPEDNLTPEKLISLILQHRKIKDVKEFLNPKPPSSISLSDFDLKYKKSFANVTGILDRIKKDNGMIVVYTDYDADGITGGAILWETLHHLGFKAMPYVPDRKKEGYGFSIAGIDNVIKQFDPRLIISVDHGITKAREVEYAKKKNIKVIVTDHHLKSDETPKADAIFHIPALSGSGVAYFFAKEIYKHFSSLTANNDLLTANFSSDYLALASIGTIADLVPLVGPSRSIVKHGLEVFPKVTRFGIRHILKQAGIEGRKITPYEVGFIIAPRINAVGRLYHAIDALRLLCTTSEEKARELAGKIGKINTDRQALVEKYVNEARSILQTKSKSANRHLQGEPATKIIILVSDSWNEGIIGLIASKIAEEFYRPVIVMTKTDGHYKGSARSIPSFHVTDFLRGLKDHLVDVGGHAQAAGFTVEEKKLAGFKAAAIKSAEKLIREKDLERQVSADIKIPVSKINISLARSLESLEPFGIGNPRPAFLSQAVITGARLFGKQNDHLKVFVSDPDYPLHTADHSIEMIAFGQAELFKNLNRGQETKVVYTLEIDRWNNNERIRGRLVCFC